MTDQQPDRPLPRLDAATARTIERLWSPPSAPRRSRTPLTADLIVDTAAGLADAEGLSAITMARVGKALGVTPMALYRHVANKEELLALLADQIGDVPDFPAGISWRDGLELWVRAQIDLILRRPWVLDLPLAVTVPGPHRLAWIDRAFALMTDVPLPSAEKFRIIALLAQHVLGEARVQAEARRAAIATVRHQQGLPDSAPDTDVDPMLLTAADPFFELELLLREHAPRDAYPALLAAATDWGPTPDARADPADQADDTAFGLRILLDGIEQHIARQTGPA